MNYQMIETEEHKRAVGGVTMDGRRRALDGFPDTTLRNSSRRDRRESNPTHWAELPKKPEEK